MSPPVREIFILAFAFAFGAVIGSFLNVVIYRLPRREQGLGLARPRVSICPACRAPILWYDNIPLASYFALGGRCRSCREPIPLRYFLVELITASLFALLASRYLVAEPLATGAFLVQAAFSAALIAVAFIDIEHRIIPDRIDIPGMALAPLLAFAIPWPHAASELATLGLEVSSPRFASLAASLFGIAAGAGIIYAIAIVAEAVLGILRRLKWTEKTEAMGFGDVKLLGMIGGYLGWKGVLLALLIACLAGAAIGLGAKRLGIRAIMAYAARRSERRRLRGERLERQKAAVERLVARRSYIPFGPFLALGAVVVMLWRMEIIELLFVRYPAFIRGVAPIGVAVAGWGRFEVVFF